MANNHMGDVAHGQRIIAEMKTACAGFDFRFAIETSTNTGTSPSSYTRTIGTGWTLSL